MKPFRIISILVILGLVVFSCEKQGPEPVQDLSDQDIEFLVPDIPDDIAALMSDEDIELFKAGPGDFYLEEPALKSKRRKCGRWHPLLMKLEYHLQFWPISSCDNWSETLCFPTDCIPMGVCGFTIAEGNWFFKVVHSEYYPIFCFPDYAGHGQGFHETDDGKLSFVGENTPFHHDDEGNATFRLDGQIVGDASTGIFEGARGWEIMISYTAAENSPSNPTGQGLSQTITFGWVYY